MFIFKNFKNSYFDEDLPAASINAHIRKHFSQSSQIKDKNLFSKLECQERTPSQLFYCEIAYPNMWSKYTLLFKQRFFQLSLSVA